MLTIIGALLFHGPVREGKGWVQQAIAAKRSLELARFRFFMRFALALNW